MKLGLDIAESARIAWSAIIANKGRGALTTLSRVVFGRRLRRRLRVAHESTLEEEMSVLGAQTFQVQKWHAGGFTSDDERRKAMRRPPVTIEDAEAIHRNTTLVDSVGSELWEFARTVRYRGESTEPNIVICGGDPQYSENNTHYIELGRNLSEIDLRAARKVVVIGSALADRFFPFEDPIGRVVLAVSRRRAVPAPSRTPSWPDRPAACARHGPFRRRAQFRAVPRPATPRQ